MLPQVLEALIGFAVLRARQGEVSTALAWLRLVQQHPSGDAQYGVALERALTRLRPTFSAAEIATGLAHGKELKLEEVVNEVSLQDDHLRSHAL